MAEKIKECWQINTERMAKNIHEATRSAQTEEDLKMALEPILQKAYQQIGVNIDIVQYEKRTALKAKIDAVYGYLIIEYKRPGKLESKGDIRLAEQQLQKYLIEESLPHRPNDQQFLEKAVGVAIDGRKILFVRYARTERLLSTPIPIQEIQKRLFPSEPVAVGFCRLGPYPIKEDSLSNLLIYVRAAARRPLTAENLAQVFGPENPLARQAVSEIYSAAMRSQRFSRSSRIKTFFKEWDRIFGVIYGQELKKAEKEAAETAALYGMPGGIRLKQLLFSIHTYYAFIMKIIAIELLALQKDQTIISFVRDIGSLDDKQLKVRLVRLESGLDFSDRGITNFLEADFFRWYLDEWSPSLANVFRNIARALSEFEPTTPILEPEWTMDLLKKLYELIVPKKLRHDLGEYYTPDWLALHLIQKSGYTGIPTTRMLDPACGSGTFLIQAIQMAKDSLASQKEIEMAKVGQDILNNIVGFDLNPLAVLAARTNYLIAFSPFIPYVRPISIPVFLCDSVVTPTDYVRVGGIKENRITFTTTKADYIFPLVMQDKERIDRFTGLIDVAINAGYSREQFSELLKQEFAMPEKEYGLLLKVFEQIKDLERKKENGIWARYIKNAFAPVYMGKFDYVLGNPPWIRWGYLSDHYRKRTLDLWRSYGLFSLKGHETRLGAGEKDFSMLFTYACTDHYMDRGGVLGLVITIEAFKSKGAGEGFRGFELKNEKIPLKILSMEDMVDLKPFQAANKTSIFTMEKGAETAYPVTVTQWKRKPGQGPIPMEWTLEKVKANTTRHLLDAVPIDPKKLHSSWQTVDRAESALLEKLKGLNPYKAYLGARVEPYGVFWLQINEVRPDDLLVVSNMHDRGKRVMPSVTASIESELVYPAVSGGDLVRFGFRLNFYVLIAQDPIKRRGYDEEWMITHLPLTYGYLVNFKDALITRAAYQKYFHREIKKNGKIIARQPTAPFYSMYNISWRSLSKYRVVWKRMASKMVACVLSRVALPYGRKDVISTDTTSFFALDNKMEAHYLCAILNSTIVDAYIKSFSAPGRGFGAPSVMETLGIPLFDEKDPSHGKLAQLSIRAHKRVAADKDISIIEEEIEDLVRKLWNIKF
jgi:hypothetical protein